MTRRYARALRGELACDIVPRNYGDIITLVSAINLSGIQTQMAFDGAMNTITFITFIKEFLVSTLRPGQVVIMDRLTSHLNFEVRALIEEAGCYLVFLPSYSPDFNPIELMFSWLKRPCPKVHFMVKKIFLRSVKARNREDLLAAIGRTEELISNVLVGAWFAACNYII